MLTRQQIDDLIERYILPTPTIERLHEFAAAVQRHQGKERLDASLHIERAVTFSQKPIGMAAVRDRRTVATFSLEQFLASAAHLAEEIKRAQEIDDQPRHPGA